METLDSYLEGLASHEPLPGGGSAATIVAAVGAALAAMVARIGARNPKYAESHALASEIVRQADELRAALAEARTRDEAAFAEVVAAQNRSRRDPAEIQERRRALEAALAEAAQEPLAAAALSLDVLRLTVRLLQIPAPGLASDVGCAAEFARAAIAGCAYNVRVNHRFMHDERRVTEQAQRLSAIESEAAAAYDAVRAAVATRLERG